MNARALQASQEDRLKHFYHFTSKHHWVDIEADQKIRTTESNLHMTVDHFGPDVVWLVDTVDVEDGEHGLGPWKRSVRIEVNVPAIRWLDWAPVANMNARWKANLIKAGGGIECAKHWYIWPNPIPSEKWLDVTDYENDLE